MATFILIGKGENEYLLNLNTVKEIKPYKPSYDGESDDKEGVEIFFIDKENSTVYQDLTFEQVKSLVLDK